MDFWARMAAVVGARDMLAHPFYARWSNGELTRDELADFAVQYRHAMTALATASSSAARMCSGELRDHFVRESFESLEQVEDWDRLLLSLGPAVVCEEPRAATVECGRAWAGRRRSAAATLAVLYVVELGQPGVDQPAARVRRFDRSPLALSSPDRESAAVHRELLEVEVAAGADHDELIAAAESALVGGWRMLDAVDRVPLAAA